MGEKKGWEDGGAEKEGLSVGGSFLVFFLRSLLWVHIMWRCVIGLWSHQSCANRLAGKHVSLRGCWGECVCCVNHRCGTVWEIWLDGVKPILMVNRWGSWHCRRQICCRGHAGNIQSSCVYARLHMHIEYRRIHPYSDFQCFIFFHWIKLYCTLLIYSRSLV